MQRFAFYDLDRTITRYPTWSRFLLYAAVRQAPWRLLLVPVAVLAALLNVAGVLSRARLKEVMHGLLLGRTISRVTLDGLAVGFARREVRGNVHAQAVARIAADRAAGYRVIVATAAYSFYARRVAALLGIDDVIATQAVIATDGAVLAQIATDNCYGAAKFRMIAAWVADRTGDDDHCHVRFYSDHLSDLPTLAWADEAIVVNPGGALRRIAIARGWEIARWN